MFKISQYVVTFSFLFLVYACGSGSQHINTILQLILSGNTTTLAGDGTQAFQDSTDGTGATAQFNFPRGLTTDGTFLYLSESTGDRVRKINPSTGETVNLAGNGVSTFQDSTDGTGATASFIEARQITYFDNFLYLADNGSHRIRKINIATGETTTLAGDGTQAFQDSTDGTGATAQFDRPTGITHDGDDFLYVADQGNYRIRKIDINTGETTTLAGNGISADQESTDGTGATAGFADPLQVLAVQNSLYVGNSTRILKVNIKTGNTTFFAGDGTQAFQDSTDGTGATAQFNIILGLCSDSYSLFVGEAGNHRVRQVDIVTGNTTTLAGDGTQAFQDSTDGTGATAQFNSTRACIPLNGVLYVADGGNHRVRKIE